MDLVRVITARGKLSDWISQEEAKALVLKGEVSPFSEVFIGETMRPVPIRDLAGEWGIVLPQEDQWHARKTADQGKQGSPTERKVGALGCVGLAALVFAAGMIFLGAGALILPMLLFGLFYVNFCWIFRAIFKVEVLKSSMWADIRKRPSLAEFLQFVALGLAGLFVLGWYWVFVLR